MEEDTLAHFRRQHQHRSTTEQTLHCDGDIRLLHRKSPRTRSCGNTGGHRHWNTHMRRVYRSVLAPRGVTPPSNVLLRIGSEPWDSRPEGKRSLQSAEQRAAPSKNILWDKQASPTSPQTSSLASVQKAGCTERTECSYQSARQRSKQRLLFITQNPF